MKFVNTDPRVGVTVRHWLDRFFSARRPVS
jgi:hypothetical protein